MWGSGGVVVSTRWTRTRGVDEEYPEAQSLRLVEIVGEQLAPRLELPAVPHREAVAGRVHENHSKGAAHALALPSVVPSVLGI
jgi:hypothetical protein